MEQKEVKKFTFANQKVMITYKTHIDKKRVVAFMNELNKSECKFIRCAHENGDENHPYPHTHVLIDFGKRFQTKNCRIFDIDEIHPNIAPVKTKSHFANAKKYLAKEDKENADLLVETEEKNLPQDVWECKTIQEALEKNAKKFSDVSGIVQLYKMKDFGEQETDDIKPREWQVTAEKFISANRNDRSVFWLWEERGNIGKSVLISYIEQLYTDRKCLVLTDFGRMTDTANIVQQKVEAGWTCDYVLVDLKRSMRDRDSIYPVLEAFKDRRFTNMKYMGGTIRLRKSPIVIVVANWPPREDALSIDRWKIVRLAPEVLADTQDWNKYVKTDFSE